jgi:hypothetical protein
MQFIQKVAYPIVTIAGRYILTHAYLSKPEPVITALRRLHLRSDLSLAYKVPKLIIYEGTQITAEALNQMKSDISTAISVSNTLSIYYAVLVAWVFDKTELLSVPG